MGETYVITEEKAPVGYIKLKDSVEFTVKDGNNEIVIENKPITVSFNFVNREDEILDHGKITISGYFASEEIKEIVIKTDEKDGSELLNGQLVSGETYKVVVEEYKNGYLFINDFEFTVNEDGSILLKNSDKYKMNENNLISIIGDKEKTAEKVTSTKVEEQIDSDSSNVNTGDSISFIRYILILIISGFGIVTYIGGKREEKE